MYKLNKYLIDYLGTTYYKRIKTNGHRCLDMRTIGSKKKYINKINNIIINHHQGILRKIKKINQ